MCHPQSNMRDLVVVTLDYDKMFDHVIFIGCFRYGFNMTGTPNKISLFADKVFRSITWLRSSLSVVLILGLRSPMNFHSLSKIVLLCAKLQTSIQFGKLLPVLSIGRINIIKIIFNLLLLYLYLYPQDESIYSGNITIHAMVRIWKQIKMNFGIHLLSFLLPLAGNHLFMPSQFDNRFSQWRDLAI